MSLYWYACIFMNTYCYEIYHILSEIVWWALSNTSLIVWNCLAIHEILVNKDFIVTDDLISWLIVVVRHSSHWDGSLQDRLGDMQTCRITLVSAYVLCYLSAMWLQLLIIGKSLRWQWVLIWYVVIEHQRLSLIRIIFINYQTSEL